MSDLRFEPTVYDAWVGSTLYTVALNIHTDPPQWEARVYTAVSPSVHICNRSSKGEAFAACKRHHEAHKREA